MRRLPHPTAHALALSLIVVLVTPPSVHAEPGLFATSVEYGVGTTPWSGEISA